MATERRLIDANALSEKIGNMKFEITHNRGGYRYCNEDEKSEWDKLDGFDSLVCEAPTVDAVEVVHGRWVEVRDIPSVNRKDVPVVKCSKCEIYFCDLINNHHYMYHYCPNCGAKMDGERRTDNG